MTGAVKQAGADLQTSKGWLRAVRSWHDPAMLQSLRDRLAGGLLVAARRLASDAGWSQLQAGFGAPSMLGGLLGLSARGLTPRRIVDGGACKGDWTRLARQVFPHAEVLMIEPQSRHATTLEQVCLALAPGVRFAPRLVGPAEMEAVDFVVLDDVGGGTGSSVRPENSDVPRHVVKLPMTTLDSLVESTGFGAPDFIKLDVQGYEIEVLKGARCCLSTADFVLLEVSVWPYNAGAPLAAELLAWMDQQGLRTFEIFDLSRRPDGLLVQMDVLFVRKSHPLLQDVQTRFSA